MNEPLFIVLDFIESFIKNGGEVVRWLTEPKDFYFFTFTPLTLLTISGLITFITFAVIRWAIS